MAHVHLRRRRGRHPLRRLPTRIPATLVLVAVIGRLLHRRGAAATVRLHSGQHFLSQALNHEYVGFDEIADSLWNIVNYDTLLGRFDERTHTITGAHFRKEKKC